MRTLIENKGTIITVSNESNSVVKEAKDLIEAKKMASQLSAVFDEPFAIGLKYDVWAQNFDK